MWSQRTTDGDGATYPEMGVLYTLTDRSPPTFAGSHNIDVVNDAFAREEAARVLRARPAVIVYYELPKSAVYWEELVWRGGKPSGQRDLVGAAVRSLTASYHLAGTYVIAPGDPPIMVYVKK